MVIVESEAEDFARVLKQFQVTPTLSSLNRKFDKICQLEVEKALDKLPELRGEGREVIERMASSIIKKVLHDPMITLKEDIRENDPVNYTSLLRKLFRLDEI